MSTTETHDYWIVARTLHSKEKYAGENISRYWQREIYLPLYEVIVGKGVDRQAQARPLFPSYLFVRTNGQWRFLLSTYGVIGVVFCGDTPAIVQQRTIDEIRSRENKDGLVKLAPKQKNKFSQNSKVQITKKGPWAGHVGLYDGQTDDDRQKVLVNFLGRRIPMLFAKEDLVAA